MFNDKRVSQLEKLKARLTSLENPTANGVNYWHRLSDYCSKMSADQQQFVNNSPEVREAQNKMMEAFNLFLFEKYRDSFIQLDNFRPLCDNYIDTVINTSQKYSEHVTHAVDENAELKAKIAELERKLNEQCETNGTGPDGRACTNLSVQESTESTTE